MSRRGGPACDAMIRIDKPGPLCYILFIWKSIPWAQRSLKEGVPGLGDPDGDAAPGTLFEKLPEGWVCPECAEPRDQFIEA